MVMVAPALNGMVVMPTPALSCLGSGISTALHALLCSHMENTGLGKGRGGKEKEGTQDLGGPDSPWGTAIISRTGLCIWSYSQSKNVELKKKGG